MIGRLEQMPELAADLVRLRVAILQAEEAELVKIETVDEHVDRANGVVLGHVGVFQEHASNC
jgi:hypothetical protein